MAGWEPYAAMVIVEAMYSGNAILSKAAFNRGMNTFVFVFYQEAIATVLFILLAITTTRKSVLPPLPPKLLLKTFMFALFGITISLNLFYIAIKYTSPTVASATKNSIPVLTFFLSLLFGVESIKFKSFSGIGKLFGLVLCICGVMFIAFYKGPELRSLARYLPTFNSANNHHYIANSDETWIHGLFLMVICSVLWSLWHVSQATIIKDYPSNLVFVTFYSLFSAIQSFFVAMVAERQVSKWKLHWDQGLLAVAYTGICIAGIASYLQSWCTGKKGPVFVAVFEPLSLVITITISLVLLGEVINLGSVLGGALLVGGLYSVLWAKKRELHEKSLKVGEGSVSFLIDSSGPPVQQGNSRF